MNTKDCTQGFCSIYCPQWCYLLFPPPPPMSSSTSSSSPSSSFSPLVITIIGVLASAFLLVSYYAVISKFCRARSSRHDSWPHSDDMANNYINDNNNNNNNNDHAEPEPWNTRAAGLDEALIRLISVRKYNKRDATFPSSDCSVCLGEFEEGESLRLLPKCNHSFHVSCIDKWLKTHSSCPLCRLNIVSMFTLDAIQLGRPIENGPMVGPEGGEAGQDQEVLQVLPDEIVEIRDDEAEVRRSTRRSVSMDYSRIDIIEEDCDMEECQVHGSAADHAKDSSFGEAYKVLQCVMRSAVMRRSFSSGRFLFTRHARGRNSVIPV